MEGVLRVWVNREGKGLWRLRSSSVLISVMMREQNRQQGVEGPTRLMPQDFRRGLGSFEDVRKYYILLGGR